MQRGYNNAQGVRGNRYSGSKLTNWEDFEPADTAIEQAYDKYYEEIGVAKSPIIFTEKTHPNFIMPITEADIRYWLKKLPNIFTDGLKGIILLSGSNKIEKTFFSRLFCYGCYWRDCIFIVPFPKKNMNLYGKKQKPHVLNDYRRVGALVHRGDKEGYKIEWTEENLKAFYLRDVFVHEIGHHFDRENDKHTDKKEGFAEWFATEFGMKFKEYSDF